VFQPATNHKYHLHATAFAPPIFRPRVGLFFFLLLRHLFGLLMGSHLAAVQRLPASKRKYLHSAGSRFLALLVRPVVLKELRDQPWPVQLRRRLELLGPTYIKLGQIMALREDLLPREITDELKQLLDCVPEVSSKQSQKSLPPAWAAR